MKGQVEAGEAAWPQDPGPLGTSPSFDGGISVGTLDTKATERACDRRSIQLVFLTSTGGVVCVFCAVLVLTVDDDLNSPHIWGGDVVGDRKSVV